MVEGEREVNQGVDDVIIETVRAEEAGATTGLTSNLTLGHCCSLRSRYSSVFHSSLGCPCRDNLILDQLTYPPMIYLIFRLRHKPSHQ